MPPSLDRRVIPSVVFTDPEVVSAGLSPAEAASASREVRTGLFPFAADGRAMTLEDVAATVHAHPTLGEAFQEANLRALGGSAARPMGLHPRSVRGSV